MTSKDCKPINGQYTAHGKTFGFEATVVNTQTEGAILFTGVIQQEVGKVGKTVDPTILPLHRIAGSRCNVHGIVNVGCRMAKFTAADFTTYEGDVVIMTGVKFVNPEETNVLTFNTKISTAINMVSETLLTDRAPQYTKQPAEYVDLNLLLDTIALKVERAKQAISTEKKIDEVRDIAGYGLLTLARLI